MPPFEPCSPVVDPACVQPVDNDGGGIPFLPSLPDIPGAIGANVMDEAAKSFQSAVGWFISRTAAWWVTTPSPDLEGEPAIGHLHLLIRPLTVGVAVLALLVVAAKMAVSRKAVPMIDAGRGLVVLATVTVIGTVVANLVLRWGDEWCGWALDASSQGGFAERMTALVTMPSGAPSALVLVFSLIALVLGIVQALLLLFREAALVILAGLLPLAASGAITKATQSWFGIVAGWMLALGFYKPAAATVYATAFILVGEGKSLHAVLMGLAMMLISLIAFPVLLRFFTWTTGGAESGSGGGVLGALMGSAAALGALRAYGGGGSGSGGSSSASEHASYLDQQLGDQDVSHPSDGHAGQSAGQDGGQAPTGNVDDQISDPSAPSGAGQVGADQSAAPAEGGEPVGPTLVQTAEKEQQRGEEAVKWVATGGAGGPTGAAGEGGGGNGA
ncbi:hypothetical protein GCM10022254_52790 [Actinomadura meridiana]|uniref:Integral membrane protein n=1 Tax=Actinomadura meridiana TaxID=559626 RepID=A0ABP8CE02_9ACTN